MAQASSLSNYANPQSATKAIMAQSRESFHNETIIKIRNN